MLYYPVFLSMVGEKIVFAGARDIAAAKIRLLMKTQARICVFGLKPCADVLEWEREGKLEFYRREIARADVQGARLLYAANDDSELDSKALALARDCGVLANRVDHLEDSDFLTPALVDRDPVTIAIGTEGAAPVLARKIKADIEEMLPSHTGLLAKLAEHFRPVIAQWKSVSARRLFWTRFFFHEGEKAFEAAGEKGVRKRLRSLHREIEAQGRKEGRKEWRKEGFVSFIGSGTGDPELLALKARKKLFAADCVIYDRSVDPRILELARREAQLIAISEANRQEVRDLLARKARKGAHIVRLAEENADLIEDAETFESVRADSKVQWDIIPAIEGARTCTDKGVRAALDSGDFRSGLSALSRRLRSVGIGKLGKTG